jgi:hypothetical protein
MGKIVKLHLQLFLLATEVTEDTEVKKNVYSKKLCVY